MELDLVAVLARINVAVVTVRRRERGRRLAPAEERLLLSHHRPQLVCGEKLRVRPLRNLLRISVSLSQQRRR